MEILTTRQQQVLDFIERSQQNESRAPTIREIAAHFGFRSPQAATKHVAALHKKKFLTSEPGLARSLKVVSPLGSLRRPVIDIPIFGSIPAGFAENKQQEAKGCLTIDIGHVKLKQTSRTFALQVRGDSMVGVHICDGDLVIMEHGVEPKTGDVVAALIDNESTLKTFVFQKGKSYLKAENPKFPKLYPADELVIQGVMVAVFRKRK